MHIVNIIYQCSRVPFEFTFFIPGPYIFIFKITTVWLWEWFRIEMTSIQMQWAMHADSTYNHVITIQCTEMNKHADKTFDIESSLHVDSIYPHLQIKYAKCTHSSDLFHSLCGRVIYDYQNVADNYSNILKFCNYLRCISVEGWHEMQILCFLR